MQCHHCQSEHTIKDGCPGGRQRYLCHGCSRHFTPYQPRFSARQKAQALDMYLNNCGIRKTARFIGASPTAVLKWVRKEGLSLRSRLDAPASPLPAPTIEMDEIYTFVGKKKGAGRSLDGLLP